MSQGLIYFEQCALELYKLSNTKRPTFVEDKGGGGLSKLQITQEWECIY